MLGNRSRDGQTCDNEGKQALPEGVSVRTRLSTLHGIGVDPRILGRVELPSPPTVEELCGVPAGLQEEPSQGDDAGEDLDYLEVEIFSGQGTEKDRLTGRGLEKNGPSGRGEGMGGSLDRAEGTDGSSGLGLQKDGSSGQGEGMAGSPGRIEGMAGSSGRNWEVDGPSDPIRERSASSSRAPVLSQSRSHAMPLDSLLMLANYLPIARDEPMCGWGDGVVDLSPLLLAEDPSVEEPSEGLSPAGSQGVLPSGVKKSEGSVTGHSLEMAGLAGMGEIGVTGVLSAMGEVGGMGEMDEMGLMGEAGVTDEARETMGEAKGTADEAEDDEGTNVWDFVSHGEEALVQDVETIAGRYRISDRLGAGGMAQIFKVQHRSLGKEFALKIIHPEMSIQPNMRRAFFREAQVASQLDHPNIVKITDFGADDRRGAFIVMEYLRGETLHSRISREGRLRVPFALEVALQVSEALHYMHEQAIIHCDIKPENIFLCRSAGEGRRRPVVKLIDFGLSRTEVTGAKLAQSEVAGTPEYMAPEQLQGLAPQPSVDIYALGILIYHMISGQLPFAGQLMDVVRAQLETAPRSPSALLAEPLDERVEALILKALMKKPEDRQASMGRMIFEIRTLMDMLGISHQRRRGAVERRSAGQELEGPRIAFEHCPCPLFRLDLEACILSMNAAFCDFVREPQERLLGRALTSTRLGPLYPNLQNDLGVCAVKPMQIQHLISFKAKGTEHAAAALCWLVPELDFEDTCVSFTGIIVPCQAVDE